MLNNLGSPFIVAMFTLLLEIATFITFAAGIHSSFFRLSLGLVSIFEARHREEHGLTNLNLLECLYDLLLRVETLVILYALP